jgi:hypothetical protein
VQINTVVGVGVQRRSERPLRMMRERTHLMGTIFVVLPLQNILIRIYLIATKITQIVKKG